jgi:hypothetical protein
VKGNAQLGAVCVLFIPTVLPVLRDQPFCQNKVVSQDSGLSRQGHFYGICDLVPNEVVFQDRVVCHRRGLSRQGPLYMYFTWQNLNINISRISSILCIHHILVMKSWQQNKHNDLKSSPQSSSLEMSV